MLPEASIEALIVLLMFAIRIGIPIAATLAIGYWLEKKLQPREEKPAAKLELMKKSKIIQLHCWDFKKCEPEQMARCAAYAHPELPCWLALQVEGFKVRPECFTCALYKPDTKAA